MTIEIRPARVGDLDEISRVLVAAFSAGRPPADAPAELQASFERYLAHIADVRGRFGAGDLFVACDDERVVGAGLLYHPDTEIGYPTDRPYRPWPRSCAVMRLLGVDPTDRGRGIGRMLRAARIARARALGAASVAFHSSSAPHDSVLGWGFRAAPEHDYEPAPGVHARAYVLSLA